MIEASKPEVVKEAPVEWHGVPYTQDQLASLAKSHQRLGMTEDKWVSLYLFGIWPLIALIVWLVLR